MMIEFFLCACVLFVFHFPKKHALYLKIGAKCRLVH